MTRALSLFTNCPYLLICRIIWACLLLQSAAEAQSLQVLNDASRGAIEVSVGPKVYMPDQARLTFQAAWKEFRESHTYSLDGEFEPGGNCQDTPDTLDSFYIYLSTKRITKTIRFMQRCGTCSGSGKIPVQGEGNNNCPNCRGSGKEEAANTYTFFVLPANAPAKPETPRQKQERELKTKVEAELTELGVKHAAGDVEASLRLGTIHFDGYYHIPKDITKSDQFFVKAMSMGSSAGLRGHLRVRESEFKGNINEAVIIYAMRLALTGDSASPPMPISFADHLVAQGICERINRMIAKGSLRSDDLKLSKLREIARTPTVPSPINNQRAKSINSIILEYFANERPLRITGTSFKRLKDAALANNIGSFGMLGDFMQNGEGPGSRRNAQAAHIYYRLEFLSSGDNYALQCARNIEASIDIKTTDYFVNQYKHLTYNKTVNETMLQAIDEIHPVSEITK